MEFKGPCLKCAFKTSVKDSELDFGLEVLILELQWNTLNRIPLKGIFQIKEYSFKYPLYTCKYISFQIMDYFGYSNIFSRSEEYAIKSVPLY